MKRMFFFCLMSLVFLLSSICYAEEWPNIDDDCYSLAGITLGQTTKAEVIAMYGRPDYDGYRDSSAAAYNGMNHVLRWGTLGPIASDKINFLAVTISDIGPFKGTVTEVKIANSALKDIGFRTSRGIYTGMPFEEALKLYNCDSPYKNFFRIQNKSKRSIMEVTQKNGADGARYVLSVSIKIVNPYVY